MSMRCVVFLFLFLFLLSACGDRTHSFEFSVENSSDRAIFVNVQKLGEDQIDSNLLQVEQKLVLDVQLIEARNSVKASNELVVPFSMIEITDLDGQLPGSSCEQGLLDLDCWDGLDLKKRNRFFFLIETIHPADFL